ncbi:hypothetical protein HK101_001091 [Irineochytrium annulatum]|nr:hypothetical protein HK101_001091 [Irineochytrium annulatum]
MPGTHLVDSSESDAVTAKAPLKMKDTAMNVYRTYQGYFGVIAYEPADVSTAKPTEKPHTIVVLDISGSMGQNVERIVTKILPLCFDPLEYKSTDPVTLITFESNSTIIETTVAGLAASTLRSRGGTTMAPAVRLLATKLMQLYGDGSNTAPMRLLTISDGDVGDQQLTVQEASKVAEYMKDKNIAINSQAIRYYTSTYGEPDTRALCSLLQLNPASGTATNVAASTDFPSIAKQLVDAITAGDGGAAQVTAAICVDSDVLVAAPWEANTTRAMKVRPGRNVIWMKDVPRKCWIVEGEEDVKKMMATRRVEKKDEGANGSIHERVEEAAECDAPAAGGISVRVILDDSNLSWSNYELILRQKIDTYIHQLKVLKIVNTDSSQSEILRIRNYFTGLERSLANQVEAGEGTEQEASASELARNGLAARVKRMRSLVERRSKSLLQSLLEVANDEKVAQLNSAQQAAYLRNVTVSKNAKGLAKRALASEVGLDFDAVARAEVRAMAAHLSELDEVDASTHAVSFFSQATTVDGIRAACELVEDGVVDDVGVNEVLEILNIVGVACWHRIGDYPDSRSFRAEHVYFGCYISLSDILVAHLQGGGALLEAPGTDFEITTTIPLFEDKRVLSFLRKYAPKLLELTCSVGMRRVVAEVPASFEQIADDRSEVALETALKLGTTLPQAFGGYFAHIDPCLDGTIPQPADKSHNLINNGLSNMLLPIAKHLSKPGFVTETLPRVLRAVYTFDVWQIVRKTYRHTDNHEAAAQGLMKVLGLDLEKTRVPLRPLFEEEPEGNSIEFPSAASVDVELLKALTKPVSFLENIVNIVPVLNASLLDSDMSTKIEKLRSTLVNPSPDAVTTALGIPDYPYADFQLHNVVQAYLYRTKADRISATDESVILPDLSTPAVGESMIAQFVRQVHRERYEADLRKKRDQESEILTAELVTDLVTTSVPKDFVSLLRDGKTRGPCNVRIVNQGSPGYQELLTQLVLSPSTPPPPLHTAKLRVFLLGRTKDGEEVWNRGNVLGFVQILLFEAIFEAEGRGEAWKEIFEEYKERRRHSYRHDKYNRHGHGNDKPSFWALGYKDMTEFKEAVTKEQYEEYRRVHISCCNNWTAKERI